MNKIEEFVVSLPQRDLVPLAPLGDPRFIVIPDDLWQGIPDQSALKDDFGLVAVALTDDWALREGGANTSGRNGGFITCE